MRRIQGSRRAGLFVAAMLTAAGTVALPAHAAGSSAAPIVQAFQAMFAANSFRVAITSVDGDGANYASRSAGDMIFVRQGKSFAIYLKMTTHQKMMGKTSTQVTEMVSTATRLCMRQQPAAWSCHSATGSAFIPAPTPDQLRKASEEIKQVTPLGSRTVDGQLCHGYRFLGGSEQTTLWISAANQRPVQLNLGGGRASNSQTAMSTTITETFSNWNDPSLKIPSV